MPTDLVPLDNITYYPCDVSKWEEVEAVHKKIVEEVGALFDRSRIPEFNAIFAHQIGHPTILINNAGVVQGKLLLDLAPEELQQCDPSYFASILT